MDKGLVRLGMVTRYERWEGLHSVYRTLKEKEWIQAGKGPNANWSYIR